IRRRRAPPPSRKRGGRPRRPAPARLGRGKAGSPLHRGRRVSLTSVGEDARSSGEETAKRYARALDDVSTLGDLSDRSIFVGPYRRLFTAQVVSSFGDWVGFLAVVSLAASAGKSNADVAVGVVLSARLI